MKKILAIVSLCAGTSLYAQPGKIKHQNQVNAIAAQASAKAAAKASVNASQASVKATQKIQSQALSKAEMKAAQQAKFKAQLEAVTQSKLKSSLTQTDNNPKNDLNFQKRLHTNLKNLPAQVERNFGADYSSALNINWSKEKGNWYATYDLNGFKNVTAYHANGTRLYTATRIPNTNLPAPVLTYTTSTATTLANHDVLLIEVPGEAPVYQLTLMNGNVVYVSNTGTALNNYNASALVVR